MLMGRTTLIFSVGCRDSCFSTNCSSGQATRLACCQATNTRLTLVIKPTTPQSFAFFPDQTNVYSLRPKVQESTHSCDGGYTFMRFARISVIDMESNSFRHSKIFWTVMSDFSQSGVVSPESLCPNPVCNPFRDLLGTTPHKGDIHVLTISINFGFL